jgi:hypothetical protein
MNVCDLLPFAIHFLLVFHLKKERYMLNILSTLLYISYVCGATSSCCIKMKDVSINHDTHNGGEDDTRDSGGSYFLS